MEENIKNTLMELDKKFDEDTAVGGAYAWASYFAEDGVMVVAKGDDIIGKESIFNAISELFSLPGFSLRWKVIDANVSKDGSLGYTYGTYVRRTLDVYGNEVITTGKYTTIWQKQNDMSWKIVHDIGN